VTFFLPVCLNDGRSGGYAVRRENAVCQWRSDVNVMAAKVFNFPLNCFQLSKESSLVPHMHCELNSTQLNSTRLCSAPLRSNPRLKPHCPHVCLCACVSRYVRSIKLHTKALRCRWVLQVLKVPPVRQPGQSVSQSVSHSIHPSSPSSSCHNPWKGPRRIVIIVKKLQHGLCCDCRKNMLRIGRDTVGLKSW